ncbi:MAG TPA: hypothetical protein VLB84_07455 [Bacteroidia bacterium]|nr:hypothetical protein [Bacteroidia bacterium]
MKLLKLYAHLLVFSTSLFSLRVFSQPVTNFSGLKNMDLVKIICSADDFQRERERELPGGGLPEWGASPVKKDLSNAVVERVSVREDRTTQLKAELYYNGFDGGSVKVMVANDKAILAPSVAELSTTRFPSGRVRSPAALQSRTAPPPESSREQPL